MKKYFNISLIFTILFIISCGDVENGEDGVDGMNTLVKNETEPNGSNCSNGGTKLSFGQDLNGNGVLSVDEVLSTTYVCNGDDGTNGTNGTDGTDGTDGGDNVTVLIVQLTDTEFGFVDSDNDGDGYLGVTVTNDVITSDVVNNGTITVEKLIGGDYYQLPFTNYYGETSTGYGFSVEGYYMYSQGQVDVVWGSTYLFSPTQWGTLIDTWSGTYKIRIVSPS